MELRQLQYFAAVARHRHFRRAAEDLYVTQSAVSQQIRRLEAELGLALLRRTPAGVELTQAGAELLGRAEAILADVAGARAAMDAHAGLLRGPEVDQDGHVGFEHVGGEAVVGDGGQ